MSGDGRYHIWVDGSADGGPGGVGVCGRNPDGEFFETHATLDQATNQQAELHAAIHALRVIDPEGVGDLIVYSDSQYLVRGASDWVHDWQLNGWRTKTGQAVKNRDEWEALLALVELHDRVEFRWVRGHAGNVGNERAHSLAERGREEALQEFPLVLDAEFEWPEEWRP